MSEPVQTRLSASLLLFLAWKGIMQNRLIAILLCVAVAGGVTFQIPNAANFAGYEDELKREGITEGLGDVRVRPREGSRFTDADSIAAALRARPHVRDVVPILTLPGAVGKRDNFKSALIVGIDPGLTHPPYRLSTGHALGAGDSEGAVIGTLIAKRAGIALGDEVQVRVILGNGEQATSFTDELGRYTMNVRGLAAGTFFGQETVLVDRAFLADELGTKRAASMLLVHLDDHAAATREAASIQRDMPDVQASGWAEDSPFIHNALSATAAIRFVSRTMAVLAVLIPVWALLYVHVLNRRRQIGILGALGFTRSEVFRIYLAQASIVGLIGCVVGCACGYAVVLWFVRHPLFHSAEFILIPLVNALTFAVPALLVLGATLVAGVFPAWRAARVEPAATMRGAE